MVAIAGSYYSTPFMVHQGVTQGGYLSPTIFNIVVDAVICHWIILATGEDAGPDGFWWLFQWLVEFFYANDGLVFLPSIYHFQ